MNDSVRASKSPVGMLGGTLEDNFGKLLEKSTEGFLEGFAEELLEEFSEALLGKNPPQATLGRTPLRILGSIFGVSAGEIPCETLKEVYGGAFEEILEEISNTLEELLK